MKLGLIFMLLSTFSTICSSNSLNYMDKKINHIKVDEEFYASFQMVREVHSEPEVGFTGLKFFIRWDDREEENEYKTARVEGFKFKRGKRIEFFSFSREVVNKLKQVNLQKFNYEKAKALALPLARAEAKAKGIPFVLHGRDGASWNIKIQTPTGLFELNRGQVNGEIDGLAKFNHNIKKLESVINILALHYGRSAIGFE